MAECRCKDRPIKQLQTACTPFRYCAAATSKSAISGSLCKTSRQLYSYLSRSFLHYDNINPIVNHALCSRIVIFQLAIGSISQGSIGTNWEYKQYLSLNASVSASLYTYYVRRVAAKDRRPCVGILIHENFWS